MFVTSVMFCRDFIQFKDIRHEIFKQTFNEVGCLGSRQIVGRHDCKVLHRDQWGFVGWIRWYIVGFSGNSLEIHSKVLAHR